MSISLYIIIPALFLFTSAAFTSQEDPYEAVIETELQNNMLAINNMFVNNSADAVDFTYRFKSERISKAGSNVVSQAGRAAAGAGQTITLSRTAVSLSEGDSYTLSLEIINGDEVVAQKSLTFPE